MGPLSLQGKKASHVWTNHINYHLILNPSESEKEFVFHLKMRKVLYLYIIVPCYFNTIKICHEIKDTIFLLNSNGDLSDSVTSPKIAKETIYKIVPEWHPANKTVK